MSTVLFPILRALQYVGDDGGEMRGTVLVFSELLQTLLHLSLVVIGKIFAWGVAQIVAGMAATLMKSWAEMVSAAVGCHLIEVGVVDSGFESLADLFVSEVEFW